MCLMFFRCIGIFLILRFLVGWFSCLIFFVFDYLYIGVLCGIKFIECGLVVKNDVGLVNEFFVNLWGFWGMEFYFVILCLSVELMWGLIYVKGEVVEV